MRLSNSGHCCSGLAYITVHVLKGVMLVFSISGFTATPCFSTVNQKEREHFVLQLITAEHAGSKKCKRWRHTENNLSLWVKCFLSAQISAFLWLEPVLFMLYPPKQPHHTPTNTRDSLREENVSSGFWRKCSETSFITTSRGHLLWRHRKISLNNKSEKKLISLFLGFGLRGPIIVLWIQRGVYVVSKCFMKIKTDHKAGYV